jgi:hypothetical protein
MRRVDLPAAFIDTGAPRPAACKSGEHRRWVAILEFSPDAEVLRAFSLHHRIQSNRRCQPTLIGGDETNPEAFQLTLLLIEALRYEHAGSANGIHCR